MNNIAGLRMSSVSLDGRKHKYFGKSTRPYLEASNDDIRKMSTTETKAPILRHATLECCLIFKVVLPTYTEKEGLHTQNRKAYKRWQSLPQKYLCWDMFLNIFLNSIVRCAMVELLRSLS